MSQLEVQREHTSLEHARPPKVSKSKKGRTKVGELHPQEEVDTPRPINIQALQFQFPWMVQSIESRIDGMQEAVHGVSSVVIRGTEVEGILHVLMARFRKLHERIQTLREGVNRVNILENLEVNELKREIKMLLSELRNFVSEIRSKEVNYTYRLLRQECRLSLTQTCQILGLTSNDLRSPRGLRSKEDITNARPPRIRTKLNAEPKESPDPAQVSTSQLLRYAKKVSKRERHAPEVAIPPLLDRDLRKVNARRKSKRAVDTPRRRKHATDVVDEPVDSPNSTTTERLLRRFRETALEDASEEAKSFNAKAREDGQRHKSQRPSGTPRSRREQRPADSPLSTSTENIVRQFRKTAVDDDVEAFEVKSVDRKSPPSSRRSSVVEGSVGGSRASAVTGSQASQASDASGVTGSTASQTDQSGASSSGISSLESTFASSIQTSAFTLSSLGDSTISTMSMESSTAMSGQPSSIIESTKQSTRVVGSDRDRVWR